MLGWLASIVAPTTPAPVRRGGEARGLLVFQAVHARVCLASASALLLALVAGCAAGEIGDAPDTTRPDARGSREPVAGEHRARSAEIDAPATLEGAAARPALDLVPDEDASDADGGGTDGAAEPGDAAIGRDAAEARDAHDEPRDAGPGDRDGGVERPPRDAGWPDAEPPESGPADTGLVDSGTRDSGPPDSGRPDSGLPDSGPPDSGPRDGGITLPRPGPGCVPLPTSAALTSTTVPLLLSETGLYTDIVTKQLAPDLLPFQPAHPLWSDGAEKRRWVHLPGCTQVDTSDLDHWQVPVGTKLFKEFSLGGARLETRMIVRVGPMNGDYRFAAYAWNGSETEAFLVPTGARDVRGTDHDIPVVGECTECHGGLPERVLGFSAVQLSHQGAGVTVADLSQAGLLSRSFTGSTIPGDPLTQDALGYLHGNCGMCHNDTSSAVVFTVPYSLRLSVDDRVPADTGVFRTAIDVPVEQYAAPGVTMRIAPRDPAASCVLRRMGSRGSTDQMPPFGTELVDIAGFSLVQSFVNALP